jgi:plasmid stabilization system protein ParE
MKSGYKILWTNNALKELESTIEYLIKKWTDKEIQNLALRIEETLELISNNPNLFQSSDVKKNIRRAVISKYNTMYYRTKGENIEILSFFSNRQNPKKRKI